ncbi:hypothetical protein LCGC14_1248960 [marine sediment metagenome]|uniref:Uncharacterized protein n=1 Tax=marine sediment metagenome TaxID=412755 RepID=A0A0F9L7F2_9ZZZZ
MHQTVLQQGDQTGTQGVTGTTGATGETGATGAFTNVLSVELKYTFTGSSVALVYTYVVEAGAASFWKASGVHSYITSGWTANPGITTITNFLETSTKKFSVHLQLQKTQITDAGGGTILLPDATHTPITAEVYKTADDEIIIRFIKNANKEPIEFKSAQINYRIVDLTFSLLIIGTDQ